MAVSFLRLLENMAAAKGERGEDDPALQVIRAGLNLRPGFWDDFTQICSNSEGLAALLDVPRHKVSNWSSKVYELLDQIKMTDDEEAGTSKATMLSTGQPD